MKKVLITGGSHSEYPVIKAAQEQGWFVITTGNDEASVGHKLADKYVKGDYSDKEFVLELARKELVDAIVSGANDFAYLSTAYACEKLGLPGHDNYSTAKLIHTKSEFRKMTHSIGVKTPQIIECHFEGEAIESADGIGFPLLVKPVDLTGGKGVKICNDPNEVSDAFRAAMEQTRAQYVILEQFVEGSPHGITCLIKNGRVVWYSIDSEQYGMNKYLVKGACSPSDIPHHSEYALINDIEKVAVHCSLVDGLFHTQFILDKTNYPVMIDPCRRMPGDLYVLLAKYTTGVDYPSEIVNAECGGMVRDFYPCEHNYIARECIMSSRSGKIKDISIADEVQKHIIYKYMSDYKGVIIEQPLKYKAGILIMKFESYEEMTDIVNRFDELVRIEFE